MKTNIMPGTVLKLIATASMLIDHICAILYSNIAAARMVRLTIGRVAMPLYIFMICEGFFRTRSRRRYGLNLLIIALISEPVYDLAFYGSSFEPSHQNVCFTLLSGFLMLCVLNKLVINKKPLLHPIVIAGFCVLTYFLHFSYDYSAVIAFAVFYYLRLQHNYIRGTAGSAALAVLENTPGALFAAIPLLFYSGRRGRINTAAKYAFYAFYPAHLLILYLVSLTMAPII